MDNTKSMDSKARYRLVSQHNIAESQDGKMSFADNDFHQKKSSEIVNSLPQPLCFRTSTRILQAFPAVLIDGEQQFISSHSLNVVPAGV